MGILLTALSLLVTDIDGKWARLEVSFNWGVACINFFSL